MSCFDDGYTFPKAGIFSLLHIRHLLFENRASFALPPVCVI